MMSRITVVVALALCLWRTPALGQPWAVESDANVTADLVGIKAISADIAWASGDSGRILLTTNGGTTWSAHSWTYGGSKLDCGSIEAFDQYTAWVVLANDSSRFSWIGKTTDGGGTWTFPLSSNTQGTFYDAVRFYDANNGIMIGDPENGYFVVQTTTDGGTTWTRTPQSNIPAPLTGETGFINNVAVFATNAWFGTSATRVFRSTDRGNTWTATNSLAGIGSSLFATSFASDQVGMVAGNTGYIAQTADGGISWGTPVSTGANLAAGLTYVSPTVAIMVGQSATMYLTSFVSTDGGNTWSSRFAPVTNSLYGVSFASSSTGWAVGANGTILKWVGGDLAASSPTATTTASEAVGSSSATLIGIVNPNALLTTAWFEWGTSSTLSNSSSTSAQSIGSGTSGVAVTANLTGLSQNTTYYYRVVGQNTKGTNKGSILNFTTASAAAADLVGISLPLSTDAWTVGQNVTATFWEKNQGSATAGPHQTQLYLSTNNVISTFDTPLGTALSYTSIAAGDSQSQAQSFAVPIVATGTYYVGAIIDINSNVLESDKTNNSPYRTGTVAVSTHITRLSTLTGRFSGGVPVSKWVLMSVPYVLDETAGPAIAGQFNGNGSNAYKMYAYTNGSFQDITSAVDAFDLYRGFWFKTVTQPGAFNLNFGTGTVQTDTAYQITIPTGWSLVGPPFYTSPATWSPLNTSAGSVGIRVYSFRHETNSWQGPLDPSVQPMQPFGGYAVWNGTGSASSFTFSRGTTATPIAEWKNGDGWFMKLNLESVTIRVGQHRNATATRNTFNYPMPPPRPEVTEDETYLEGKLWSDVRPAQNQELLAWKVFVNPKAVHSMKVSEKFGLPTGWKVVAQGIPYLGSADLTKQDSVRFPAEISSAFTITILAGSPDRVDQATAPPEFALLQNYPNPFNPSTTIRYQLDKESDVSLGIFNTAGQEIVTLLHGAQHPGYYEMRWDGKNGQRISVPSGVYFCTIRATNEVRTRKMLVLK